MGITLELDGALGAVSIVGPFPIAYNTPGLTDGVTIYTPAVDDILLDVWVEVDTAWDGTTPKGDIGTFVGGNTGAFAFNNAIDLSVPDLDQGSNGYGGAGMLTGAESANVNVALAGAGTGSVGYRRAPLKLTAANPLKFVVSQDGQVGGADPGASQGSAKVYLVLGRASLSGPLAGPNLLLSDNTWVGTQTFTTNSTVAVTGAGTGSNPGSLVVGSGVTQDDLDAWPAQVMIAPDDSSPYALVIGNKDAGLQTNGISFYVDGSGNGNIGSSGILTVATTNDLNLYSGVGNILVNKPPIGPLPRIVGPITVNYNDAGLTTGVTLYTPVVGEILMDAWVEVDTEWNGTTPTGDIGTFVGYSGGLYGAYNIGALAMGSKDTESYGAGLLVNDSSNNFSLSEVSTLAGYRLGPSKFTATNPLKFVVSQDGLSGGADPGASQGVAKVYLVIATP